MTSKKKIIVRLAKLALLLVFLINTGFVSRMINASHESEGITAEQMMAIKSYTLDKYEEEKNNPNYKAKDYFQDYLEIKEKFGDVSVVEMGWLQGLSQKNSTTEEIEAAVRDFKVKIDPGYESRQETVDKIKQAGWLGVLAWLGGAYLYLLPWVFLLFVIWSFEGSDNKKNFFKNPLGFLISLLIYPLVIGYLVVRFFKLVERQVLLSAELRRTKEKIFCVLSDDEILRIKQLAQSSLPVGSWKKQLRSEGRVIQHSLATALLASIFFLLVGNHLLAQPVVKLDSVSKQEIVIQTSISPPGILSQTVLWAQDIMADQILSYGPKLTKLAEIHIEFIVRCLSGFTMEIEHVPNCLTVLIVNQPTCLIKIKNHEKNICNNYICSLVIG